MILLVLSIPFAAWMGYRARSNEIAVHRRSEQLLEAHLNLMRGWLEDSNTAVIKAHRSHIEDLEHLMRDLASLKATGHMAPPKDDPDDDWGEEGAYRITNELEAQKQQERRQREEHEVKGRLIHPNEVL